MIQWMFARPGDCSIQGVTDLFEVWLIYSKCG
ncbi:hypothetical protein BJB45_03705 [Halomonas huangheensis]|uniref:Uncharacterized protein n=1 Tax=Halomonas huangheensis TaxID=1178482 RepID=W1N5M5_9GAMM|nr:hypothetical protein BJB45_03705 [Halomonas huangheensis]